MGKDADPRRSEVAAKSNWLCNDVFNVARAREPAFTAPPGNCTCERPLPAQVLEEPVDCQRECRGPGLEDHGRPDVRRRVLEAYELFVLV